MALIVDFDVSGEGVQTFAAQSVAYGYVNLTSLPANADIASATTPRRLIGAGWIALANDASGDGLATSEPYLRDIVWVNSERYIFNPLSDVNYGDRLVWKFATGYAGHIWLFTP